MAGFTPKNWIDEANHAGPPAAPPGTPLSAVAMEDAEDRLSTYTTMLAGTGAGIFNIEDYGAVAGVTNNRTAIQNAADAAYTAGGGVVVVPAGTFSVGSWTGGTSVDDTDYWGIRLKEGVALQGFGKGVSILRSTTTCTGNGAFIGNDQTYGGTAIAVRELTIDMDEGSHTGNGVGIQFGNAYSPALPCVDATVQGVEVKNFPYVGIRADNGSDRFRALDNVVHDGFSIGISVSKSDYPLIRGNSIYTTSDNGIDMEGSTGAANESNCRFGVISENTCRDNSTGIFLETVSSFNVTGNVVLDADAYGIRLNRIDSYMQNHTISGNTVRNAGTAGIISGINIWDVSISGNAIFVPANKIGIKCDDNYRHTISGNAIKGIDEASTAYGVVFTGTTGYHTIVGNLFAYLTEDVDLRDAAFAVVALGNQHYTVTTQHGDGLGKGGLQKVGFFDTAPIVKPTVSGVRNNPEAALADLLTELANLGLITNSTTAS